MGATKRKLKPEEESLLHVLNWMEQSYNEDVYVLDIDFPNGGVMLYGAKVSEFRDELSKIMANVYSNVESWRYW